MAKTNWTLDPAHSEIGFKIKHLMITNVSGAFTKFNVVVETDGDNFSKSNVTFTADVASITTHNDQRDTHLRSAEFFDAEKFPQLTFIANGYEVKGDEHKIKGDLTIKDITRQVELDIEFGGIAKDPWGNTKAGFTVSGKFNRKDFGLTWNAPVEAGGFLVGDDVKINGEIQLVKLA